MQFSIVVPAYNAETRLPECLRALRDQSVPGTDYEIIVVDDGSTDRTGDAARPWSDRYIFQPNKGPAAARNRGAREALGAIVLFTDDDCIPERDWLREMVRPFARPDVAGVKGAYRSLQKEPAARFAQAEFEDRYRLLLKRPFIDMIDTHSAAFRMDVFRDMGGFDESFPAANNEDTEFSYRLAGAGKKLVFNPAARVIHAHPDSFFRYIALKFRRGYWRTVVYRRYPGKALRDSYTPAVVKFQTVSMGLSFPLLLMSAVYGPFLPAAFGCWVAVLASSLPFSIKVFQKDPFVGLISPVVVLFRSAAFAAGCLCATTGRRMR